MKFLKIHFIHFYDKLKSSVQSIIGRCGPIIAEHLPKLEELYVEKDLLRIIEPFATQSKITTIAIKDTYDDSHHLTIRALIKSRESLFYARQLNVYIKEPILISTVGLCSFEYKSIIRFRRFELLKLDHPFHI